jgi:hypothetical protein
MQLNVKVIEARGLAKMDTLGKSDPDAVLQLIGSQSTFKTAAKSNTLTPVWNEQFRFSVYNTSRQALSILLRDQDVALDEDMARLELALAQIPIGRVIDNWFDLQPIKGVKVGGQVHLMLHIGEPGGPEFRETPLPPLGKPPFGFHVRIIAAADFEKMDTLGKTDPYVVISSGGHSGKTSVKANDLNPRWDEDFHIPVVDPLNTIVSLLLRDEDVVSDDDISKCELQTGILPFGRVLDTWIDLSPVGKVKKGGRLHVLLQLASASQPPFVTLG